jgi:hypothetical protein
MCPREGSFSATGGAKDGLCLVDFTISTSEFKLRLGQARASLELHWRRDTAPDAGASCRVIMMPAGDHMPDSVV